jgi:hypothetical protein
MPMFESLSDHIKHDEELEVTAKQRMLKWGLVALLSVALFGALYFAVRVLE